MFAGVEELLVEKESIGAETNARHLANPVPGDYWNEMMMPCAVVLAVNQRGVLICDKTKPVGSEHWTWDLDHVRTVTKDELRNIVRYCFCYPEWQTRMVDAYKEHIGLR